MSRKKSPFGLVVFLTSLLSAGCARAVTDFGEVSMYVANMLQNHHYSRQDFDDNMSAKVLEAYLKTLDFNKVYFTSEDVKGFREKYGTTLDDRILLKDVTAAKDIYLVYQSRVKERHAWIESFLKNAKFTFDSDKTIDSSRDKSDWPADTVAADALWAQLIEGEMLQEELIRLDREKRKKKKEEEAKANPPAEGETPKPEAKPSEEDNLTDAEKVLKRYTRFLESLAENDDEEIVNYFLSALSATYDPHSEYFSKSELDNFEIGLQHKLIGIGALLQSKDGAAQITGLVVGGPADKSGLLEINDRVIGVAQGEDGEMIDVMYMKLDKVVEMIRGKDGSIVRLKLTPADGGMTKEISLVRAEVPLKDKLANAEIIDMTTKGVKRRIGWINIASFYADMESGSVSMTEDVEKLLAKLMKEGIDGLVIDLRGNGGGSLDEAVKLTGLFVPKGPVVQAKDKSGNISFRASDGAKATYNGPLIVLTDKTSASASEIFAAALQDYRRALIVGDSSTFGKGTVQQVMDVSRFMPFFSDKKRAGALKITIQKFYRIAGGSTQLRGVIPDIVYPDWKDVLDIGESALDGPLPYDEIPTRDFSVYQPVPFDPATLLKKYEERLASEPEFQWIKEDMVRLKAKIDENTLSLNLQERIKERDENEARLDERKAARKDRIAAIEKSGEKPYQSYVLRLDNLDAPELTKTQDVSEEDNTGMKLAKGEDEDEKVVFPYDLEPQKRETLNIIQDMIEAASKPVAEGP
jgi:carboxyl-terminal processing protease